MLRLWRSSQSLAPTVAGLWRGLAAGAVDGAAATSIEQAVYSKRIDRKCRNYEYMNMLTAKEIKRVRGYLESRGLSQTQALRALSKHVMLAYYTVEMMESKIAWLEKLGLSDQKINKIILQAPNILGMSIEKYDAVFDWYLSQGVPKEKIPHVFYVFPHGVGYSINENLDPKVNILKEVGCDDRQVARIIVSGAQIFRLSMPRLRTKLAFLTTVGVPEARLPQTPWNEMLGDGAGARILLSNPIMIMSNVGNLRRSFDYLVSTVGFRPERLARHFKLLARSVDGILKPRHEFLKAKGVDALDKVDWVYMAGRLFIERYPDYQEYLAQYKANQTRTGSS